MVCPIGQDLIVSLSSKTETYSKPLSFTSRTLTFSQITNRPYFYIAVKKKSEKIVASFLERKYRSQIAEAKVMGKMDLDKIEHMTGK